MKFSSRDLLGYSAFVAISLASMRIGGLLATLTLIVVALVAIALLIVALVDRSVRRGFAIGFLVPLLSYAGVHSFSGRNELDPYDDFALPTTHCFQPFFRVFVSSTWVDFHTGKELPDYDPTVDPSRHSGGGGMISPSGMVTTRETPSRATFMLLGHSLVAISLGLIGGRFGVYIHKSQDVRFNFEFATADNHVIQRRTGRPFFRLLACRSPVPADHYRYPTES